MHQLGPETGASSKAGKAGKLPQQPFARWEQSELQRLCCLLTQGPGEQRSFRGGKSVGPKKGKDRARQLAATPFTFTSSTIPIKSLLLLLLFSSSLSSSSSSSSPFSSSCSHPLRRIRFRFTSHLDSCSSAVCLVKDLQVVIETIFWL